jgi:DNA-binding transcriptional LysR family regulator
MELNEIKYFLTIAEEGSLTKAAQKLYITQPGLSRFLSKLERTIGTLLFYRLGNNLSLTPAGKIYYENAKKIWEIQNDCMEKIRNISIDDQRTIRLSLPGERCVSFVMKLIGKMPSDTMVQLVESESTRIVDAIKHHDVDFGMIALQEEDPELSYVPISREEIVLIISPDHPFATKSVLKKDDIVDLLSLRDELFALPRDNTFLWALCRDYFDRIHFSPNARFLVRNSRITLEIVESGMAVGFCVKSCVPKNRNIMGISLRTPFSQKIALAYRKNESIRGAKKKFVELVEENRELF